MSHTPGPWSLRPSGVPRTWVVSAGNYVIAFVGGYEADARLIAAAPEMYEALTSLREYFEVLVAEHPPEAIQPVARLRIGLAKAEGREP